MMFTRFMLGMIGVLGLVSWCFFSLFCYAYNGLGAVGISNVEWCMAIAPMVVFAFYLIIAIRPCSAIMAFWIGLIVHLPVALVVIPYLTRIEVPIPIIVLLPGFMVWMVYIRLLPCHRKKD
jgi:hypothetical protein